MGVLPRMKCPHRLEPHQIQGLDFIHIYPVIQWLVKLAIATRDEMGDYIRAFSESQFSKEHSTPEVHTGTPEKNQLYKLALPVVPAFLPTQPSRGLSNISKLLSL